MLWLISNRDSTRNNFLSKYIKLTKENININSKIFFFLKFFLCCCGQQPGPVRHGSLFFEKVSSERKKERNEFCERIRYGWLTLQTKHSFLLLQFFTWLGDFFSSQTLIFVFMSSFSRNVNLIVLLWKMIFPIGDRSS